MTRTALSGALSAASLLATLVVLACQDNDQTAPRPRAPETARSQIYDGAHGGTPHFYFLPPMVPQPHSAGTFDASLTPSVEICALSDNVCTGPLIASFTMTTGSGGSQVRVNTTDQTYAVNWNTGATTLDLTKVYRITVKQLSTELGHCDVRLVNNGSQAKNASTGDDIVLVDGRTLPIKFRIEQGAVAVIGTDGGVARLNDGAVTLTFPAGAVTAPVAVTATPVAPGSESATDASALAGTQYEFQPSPTSFSAPVTLTLKAPDVLPARVNPASLALCKMTGGVCVPITGSVSNVAEHTVSAPVQSFSEYAETTFPEVLYRLGSEWTEPLGWWLHTAGGDLPFPQDISWAYTGPLAAFSPDGASLAYAGGPAMSGKGEGLRPLNLLDVSTMQVRVLETQAECRPLWSPEGSSILIGQRDGNDQNSFAMISPTGTRTNFADLAVGSAQNRWRMLTCSQTWTPTGQVGFTAIRYADTDSLVQGIWVMNRDGSQLRLLVASNADYDPNLGYPSVAWSADGSHVAFYADWVGDVSNGTGIASSGVYVSGGDGANPQLLLRRVRQYQWSPVPGDNRLVLTASGDAYRGDPWGYGSLGNPDSWDWYPDGIYLVNATNGSKTLLVELCGQPACLVADPVNPSWSPDGSRIAVEDWRGGSLFMINADGSGLQTLVPKGPDGIVTAIWRPRP
jgi:Tol biopolymer transport system component